MIHISGLFKHKSYMGMAVKKAKTKDFKSWEVFCDTGDVSYIILQNSHPSTRLPDLFSLVT